MAHQMPQIEGVKHRFVRAGEMDFHVALAGEGDPVLLLHGWPQHWWQWRRVIPKLAERHRVVAMDLRGFGWSDIAWTGFEKENMADDVIAVLEALELERVRIVGHDWGAWIGYLLALRRPDLVQQLVAISAPTPWNPASPRNLLSAWRLHHMLTLASPLGRPLVSRRYYVLRKLRRWAKQSDAIGKDGRRLYARDLRASTRARASSLCYRTFVARELLPVVRGRYRPARLEVPTLALHGEKDPLMTARQFTAPQEGGDNFSFRGIPNAGHFLPEESPEEVLGAVGEFFGQGTTAAREAVPR